MVSHWVGPSTLTPRCVITTLPLLITRNPTSTRVHPRLAHRRRVHRLRPRGGLGLSTSRRAEHHGVLSRRPQPALVDCGHIDCRNHVRGRHPAGRHGPRGQQRHQRRVDGVELCGGAPVRDVLLRASLAACRGDHRRGAGGAPLFRNAGARPPSIPWRLGRCRPQLHHHGLGHPRHGEDPRRADRPRRAHRRDGYCWRDRRRGSGAWP